MSAPRIISATISPTPKSIFDALPKVTALFDDGQARELFDYYPDEISFTEAEFVGLTEDEAHQLKGRKDRDYLHE